MRSCYICQETTWLAECGETLEAIAPRLMGDSKRIAERLASHLRSHGEDELLARLRGGDDVLKTR